MTTETMSVHKALAELKVLDKRMLQQVTIHNSWDELFIKLLSF